MEYSIKLYHGSTTEVKEPLANVGRKELDFGPGFITAEQALDKLVNEELRHQVCISRQEIIDKYMVFVSSEVLL